MAQRNGGMTMKGSVDRSSLLVSAADSRPMISAKDSIWISESRFGTLTSVVLVMLVFWMITGNAV